MQYHSNDCSVSTEEFKRIFLEAARNTTQMLLVSPGPIRNLETQFSRAFSSEAWKVLFRDRQIPAGPCIAFLEATGTATKFTGGNVYLPYAGMHTVHQCVNDFRSTNTFFLPQSAEDLKAYLLAYPNSNAI